MKQPQSQKYSVAWFKIADFVARGEKERALGVYRLLSHSIDDAALNYQLEGDILFSCKDSERALTKYEQAADCYQQQQRWAQSIGLYEHMLLLRPAHYSFKISLIYLYLQVHAGHQAQEHALFLMNDLMKNAHLSLLSLLFEQHKNNKHSLIEVALLLVRTSIEIMDISHAHKQEMVEIIVSIFKESDKETVTLLLKGIEKIDVTWYQYAVTYAKSKNVG